MFKIRKELWLVVLALVLLVAVTAPSVHAADHKLTVKMSEPFQVGGVLYPAEVLSLHEVRQYSPVATFHEVRIDGQSLGLLMARVGQSPTPARRDSLIFGRSSSGHLVLTSVAHQGEPVRKLYHLSPQPNGRQWLAAVNDPPVLLASK